MSSSHRSSKSSYSRLNTEDEEEEELLPLPKMRAQLSSLKQQAPVGCCPVFCTVFSLIAIIFLSVVAILLSYESLYFEVSKRYSDRKAELIPSVMGAILMYGVCFIFSLIAWCRGSCYTARNFVSEFSDD